MHTVLRPAMFWLIFYLPHGFIPEGEVVHAALARRTRPEALEDDVGDPLRGEHVASYHRRRRRGVEEAPLGDADLHWCEASLLDIYTSNTTRS